MKATITTALLLALLIGLVSSFELDTSRFDPDTSSLDLVTSSLDLDTPTLERRASSTWQNKCHVMQLNFTCEYYSTTKDQLYGYGFNFTQATIGRKKAEQEHYDQIGHCVNVPRRTNVKNAFVFLRTGCLTPDNKEKADGLALKFDRLLFFKDHGCFANWQTHVGQGLLEPTPEKNLKMCHSHLGDGNDSDVIGSFALARKKKK